VFTSLCWASCVSPTRYNIHNNAKTFRPYQPGFRIGDTTPDLPVARPNSLYEAPAKQTLEHNIKIMEELDRVKILDEDRRTNLREMRVQLEQIQATERNRDEGCRDGNRSQCPSS
jgi:hypothetical protein